MTLSNPMSGFGARPTWARLSPHCCRRRRETASNLGASQPLAWAAGRSTGKPGWIRAAVDYRLCSPPRFETVSNSLPVGLDNPRIANGGRGVSPLPPTPTKPPAPQSPTAPSCQQPQAGRVAGLRRARPVNPSGGGPLQPQTTPGWARTTFRKVNRPGKSGAEAARRGAFRRTGAPKLCDIGIA
jgi:hypothetical protein